MVVITSFSSLLLNRVTYLSKSNVAVLLVWSSSVAMMRSTRARGYPVAASSDVAFENRLGFALDVQIDGGLFLFNNWVSHSVQRSREQIILTFVLTVIIPPTGARRC